MKAYFNRQGVKAIELESEVDHEYVIGQISHPDYPPTYWVDIDRSESFGKILEILIDIGVTELVID